MYHGLHLALSKSSHISCMIRSTINNRQSVLMCNSEMCNPLGSALLKATWASPRKHPSFALQFYLNTVFDWTLLGKSKHCGMYPKGTVWQDFTKTHQVNWLCLLKHFPWPSFSHLTIMRVEYNSTFYIPYRWIMVEPKPLATKSYCAYVEVC